LIGKLEPSRGEHNNGSLCMKHAMNFTFHKKIETKSDDIVDESVRVNKNIRLIT
jgi:hypothetical protein